MKSSEVKLRLTNFVNGLIDTYFSGTSVRDKMINSTLKIIVKQNTWRADDMLKYFQDQNGEINFQEIIGEFANNIGDSGMTIDIRDYINNDFIKSYLPNKVLIVNKDDIMGLLL